MASYIETYMMIRITWNLRTAHLLATFASALVPRFPINVKGEGGIIHFLEAVPMTLERFSDKHGRIKKIGENTTKWINFFEKEYADPKKYGILTKQVNLTPKDASQLASDINDWFEIIYSKYDKPPTQLIDGKELIQQTKELSKKLDGNDKKDLIDGHECLINNIPTPGVMIFYRVAESMVRKYYVYEMKCNPPESSTMGSLANEIRKKQATEIGQNKRSKPDSLLNYILSQIDDRNLAQHPESRFDQTEAEEIFIFLKKLINDVQKKINE